MKFLAILEVHTIEPDNFAAWVPQVSDHQFWKPLENITSA